jgi:hypothetical protein
MQFYQFNNNVITNTFESLYDELLKFKNHVEDQVHFALKNENHNNIENYLKSEADSLRIFLERDNFNELTFKLQWAQLSSLDSLYFFRISNAIYFKGIKELDTGEWSQMLSTSKNGEDYTLPLKTNFWNTQPTIHYKSDYDNLQNDLFLHLRATCFMLSEDFAKCNANDMVLIKSPRFYYNVSITNEIIIVEVYKVSDNLFNISNGDNKKSGCF